MVCLIGFIATVLFVGLHFESNPKQRISPGNTTTSNSSSINFFKPNLTQDDADTVNAVLVTLLMFGPKYDIDAGNCSDSITSR
jgi:hypothetical protein